MLLSVWVYMSAGLHDSRFARIKVQSNKYLWNHKRCARIFPGSGVGKLTDADEFQQISSHLCYLTTDVHVHWKHLKHTRPVDDKITKDKTRCMILSTISSIQQNSAWKVLITKWLAIFRIYLFPTETFVDKNSPLTAVTGKNCRKGQYLSFTIWYRNCIPDPRINSYSLHDTPNIFWTHHRQNTQKVLWILQVDLDVSMMA